MRGSRYTGGFYVLHTSFGILKTTLKSASTRPPNFSIYFISETLNLLQYKIIRSLSEISVGGQKFCIEVPKYITILDIWRSRYNGSLWIGGNFSRVQLPHIFPFPNDTPSFLYATVAEMGFRVKIGIPFLAITTSSSARAFSIGLEKWVLASWIFICMVF